MAIAYARPQVISRAAGRSVVACAAYRAAEKLYDARQDKEHHYKARGGVIATGILTPTNAPAWMRDRETLWNAVEHREDRSNRPDDAQLAREVVIALPHELDAQGREYLLKNILKEGATRKGMVADYSIHAPDKEGDTRNYHAHVLLTMRAVDPADPDGFGLKVREWNDKKELAEFKEIIERETNKMLERYGVKERISFDAGDKEQSIHLGHDVMALERRGIRTQAGDFNRDVQARNEERAALAKEWQQAERQLAALGRAERAATMSDAPRDILTGITEAFGKNLERGELGERFNDYLKEQGLRLERDKADNLYVSNGARAVLLGTVISAQDKHETLPVLEQPVHMALLPERPTPERPTPERAKQHRETERQKVAPDIGTAWRDAERDPFQLGINLGARGLTLATSPRGNFVAVDDRGTTHFLTSAALGEDSRKVERALRETFRNSGVSLPTVQDVRAELKAERSAQWRAQKAEERRIAFEQRKTIRDDDRAARLAKMPIVQEMGRLYASADSGPAFVAALEDKNILLARVTHAEAVMSQHRHEAAKSHGHFAPAYEAGQYVAVTKQGHVFTLDRVTLNDTTANIQAKLEQIDRSKQVTLTQAKEVMGYWRGDRDATPHDRAAPSVLSTAKSMAGRVGHGIGDVARVGEIVFHKLGDVLDYFFGGMAGTAQQPEPERAAPRGTRGGVPAKQDPNRARINTMERVNLTSPATRQFIESQGNAHADLLADLRRQLEEAKKRDRER